MVFGNEDSLRDTQIDGRRRFCLGGAACRKLGLHGREINAEEAALPGFTVDMYKPGVLLDDAVNRGEAHAAAFATALCSEEGFEDVFASFGIHADAGIGYGENGIRTRDSIGVKAAIGIVEENHFGFDGEELPGMSQAELKRYSRGKREWDGEPH